MKTLEEEHWDNRRMEEETIKTKQEQKDEQTL